MQRPLHQAAASNKHQDIPQQRNSGGPTQVQSKTQFKNNMPPGFTSVAQNDPIDSIQALTSCATQPHLASAHIDHQPMSLSSCTPTNLVGYAAPSLNSNRPLHTHNAVMAKHEQIFQQKLQDLGQIKQKMQHTAYEFSQDVESAITSVKTRKQQAQSQLKEMQVARTSFQVGSHLVDQALHRSITDPEIQTIKDHMRHEKQRRHKSKKKKRDKEGRQRTELTAESQQTYADGSYAPVDSTRARSHMVEHQNSVGQQEAAVTGGYLDFLERNFKRPEDCTLKNLMDSQKLQQTRTHSDSRSLLALKNKNRRVDNVKAYCLAKITKTLDTKSELAKVERKNVIKQTAAEAVRQRYEDIKQSEIQLPSDAQPRISTPIQSGPTTNRGHPPRPPTRQESAKRHQQRYPTHERKPSSGLNLFNNQFAETWDRNKNDQTKSNSHSHRPSGRYDNKYAEPLHQNLHESIMSSRIDQQNRGLDDLGHLSNQQKGGNIYQEKVTSLSTAHDYCTLGRQELTDACAALGPSNNRNQEQTTTRGMELPSSRIPDQIFHSNGTQNVEFNRLSQDEQMQQLIERSQKVLSHSKSRETSQPNHVYTHRSEVDHIHTDKINFLQTQAQENLDFASQEKSRVAELKMKAAELTQIIEEGNLAFKSPTSSAGAYKSGKEQHGERHGFQKSHLTSAYKGMSNNGSVNDNSELVQQHDITSSFLQQEEKSGNRNQAIEREHIRGETLELNQTHKGSTNDPYELKSQIAQMEQEKQFSNRAPINKFEICRKAPLAELKEDMSQRELRKEKKRKKKEQKLQQLKKLELMAQGSMSRITSCITSHLNTSMTESQFRPDTSIASEVDVKRQQSKKLTSTRKELKNLMKIQLKHSKLLEKLQKNGLVGQSHESQDKQVATTLLSQMQGVFKQLSIIQQKLDKEYSEEAQRMEMVQPLMREYCQKYPQTQMSRFVDQNRPSGHQNNMQTIPEHIVSMQSCASNETGQREQTSTRPPQQNMFGAYQEVNEKTNPTEGTSSTLFWETVGQTKQSDGPLSTKAGENKGFFKHDNADQKLAKIIVDDQKSSQTAAEENDQNQESKQDSALASNRNENQARDTGRQGLMLLVENKEGQDDSFANIKADAFCEILGQEIDRVRNESFQQVNEMRKQYESELQALRKEFSLRQNEGQDHSLTRQEQQYPKAQTVGQANLPQSESLTTNSERPFTMRDVSKEPSPLDVFQELKEVKAERDFYYDKLLRVRAKVQVAGNTNERVDHFRSQIQARSTSYKNRRLQPRNTSGDLSSSKPQLLMSYENFNSLGAQILQQQVEPDEVTNPKNHSKRVSISITPVQLERQGTIECGGTTVESGSSLPDEKRLAQTQTYADQRNPVKKGLRARTLVDSSSFFPSQSGVNHEILSQSNDNRSKTAYLFEQTKKSLVDTQHVVRCQTCMSSFEDRKSRSNSRTSLSATRKQSHPPLPQKNDTMRECLSCLKNNIAQRQRMIGAQAHQYLEDNPVPQAISSQSPVLGGSRRMTPTADRFGRSSHKSNYTLMEQTGGPVAESLNSRKFTQMSQYVNHQDAQKSGSLSRREKDIEERINRIETFLQNQQT